MAVKKGYNDIFDDSLQSGLNKLAETLDKLNNQLIDIAKTGKNIKFTGDGKNLLENEKSIENIVNATKKQIEVQKQLETVQKQSTKTSTKKKELTREEAKEIQRLSVEKQRLTKEIKDEIRLENTASNSLARKREELKKLQAQYAAADATVAKKMIPTIQKLDREVKGLERAMGDHRRNVGNYQSALQGVNTAFIKLTAGIAAGIAIFRKLGQTFGEVFNLSTSMELDAEKQRVVFGESIDIINEYADNVAHAMGMTKGEFLAVAANTQDLLVPMGFLRSDAAKMSGEINSLSGALAEWSGGTQTAAQVSATLTKALLGERQQLKQLGISISDADVKNRLLEKGQKDLTGTELQRARALATMELIMEKSTDAQTKYAEGAGSLARRQAENTAKFKEMKEQIATQLTPAFSLFTDKVSELANNLLDNASKGQGLIKFFEDAIRHVDPLIDSFAAWYRTFRDLFKAFSDIVGAFGSFNSELSAGQVLMKGLAIALDIVIFPTKVLAWTIELVVKSFANLIKRGREVLEFLNIVKKQTEDFDDANRSLGWNINKVSENTETAEESLESYLQTLSETTKETNNLVDANRELAGFIEDLDNKLIRSNKDREIALLKTSQAREIERIKNTIANETLKNEAILRINEKYRREIQAVNEKYWLAEAESEDALGKKRVEIFENELNKYKNIAINVGNAIIPQKQSFFRRFFGTQEDVNAAKTLLKDMTSNLISQTQKIRDARVENAKTLKNLSDQQINALQNQLLIELQLSEQGLANNVSKVQSELALEKEKNQKLEQEQKKALEAKIKADNAAIIADSIVQTSSLVTAAAKIFKDSASIPFVGIALAISAVAGMFAAFKGIQSNAKQISTANFATGTEYVPLNGNKKGIDTVPANLTEGERILTVEQNKKIGKLSNNQLVMAANLYQKNISNTEPDNQTINLLSQSVDIQRQQLKTLRDKEIILDNGRIIKRKNIIIYKI